MRTDRQKKKDGGCLFAQVSRTASATGTEIVTAAIDMTDSAPEGRADAATNNTGATTSTERQRQQTRSPG